MSADYTSPPNRRPIRTAAVETLVVATAFAAVGLAFGALLAWRAPGLRTPPFWYATTPGSFLAGLLVWGPFNATREKLTRSRGAAVGAIGSLVAHLFTWLFVGGELRGALFFTVLSVVLVGLLTTPIGALIGVIAAARRLPQAN